MFSVPLGGLAVQRSGRPEAAIVVFPLVAAMALALLPTGFPAPVLGVVFAIAFGTPCGAIMALPARILSPEHRAGGLGVFLTCYYVVMAFGPALAGLFRAQWGPPSAILFAAAAMLSIPALLGLMRLTMRAGRVVGA
jgi:predicted MFS family arabinose efflux permease